MIVKQLYADNPLRNFHYIIACPNTKEALVVDPLDVDQCLSTAQKEGLKITQILNTHEHWDHIDGNYEVCEKTGASILAHHGAVSKIPNVTRGLYAGDTITVGSTVSLKVLDTPGHTDSHVCLLSNSDTPSLFCGDTLFNAGVGHCKIGGDHDDLYNTFSKQLSLLSDNIRIYPGHDYILRNLEFTLNREPDNENAKYFLQKLENQSPHNAFISTMKDERKINSFLRLENATIIKKLRECVPDFPKNPSEKDVFIALRNLRDNW